MTLLTVDATTKALKLGVGARRLRAAADAAGGKSPLGEGELLAQLLHTALVLPLGIVEVVLEALIGCRGGRRSVGRLRHRPIALLDRVHRRRLAERVHASRSASARH